jgi:hypothetical protein
MIKKEQMPFKLEFPKDAGRCAPLVKDDEGNYQPYGWDK